MLATSGLGEQIRGRKNDCIWHWSHDKLTCTKDSTIESRYHSNESETRMQAIISIGIVFYDLQRCVSSRNFRQSTLSQVFNLDHYLCGGRYQNVCKGDSGGPLVANINGKFTLMGITSFGRGPPFCGRVPSVYTDVSHPSIFDFIQAYNKQ